MTTANLSYVDRRIAALAHQRQIDALRMAKRVALNIETDVDRLSRRVQAILRRQSGPFFDRQAVAETLAPLWRDVERALRGELGRMATWGYDSAVAVLTDSIPRSWWSRLRPTIPEGQLPQFVGAVLEREQVPGRIGPLAVDDGLALLRNKGSRLPDDEYRKLVKQVLFDPPSRARVEEIIFAPDQHDGLRWTDRISKWSRRVDPPQVASELATGYSAGENVQQLTKRLEQRLTVAKSAAKRIARTEAMRVAEGLQRETWDDIDDLMAGVMIHAQLDIVTRPEHAARNGKIYHKPGRGTPTLDELPNLPDEPNCRCWSTPVLMPPEEFTGIPADGSIAQTARNRPSDPSTDPTAYGEWFARADVPSRKQAVGAVRYNTLAARLRRDPEWSDFIDEEGRLLTIADLRDLPLEQLEARKQRVDQILRVRSAQIKQQLTQGFVRPGDPPEPGPVPPRRPEPPMPPEPPVSKTPKFKKPRTPKVPPAAELPPQPAPPVERAARFTPATTIAEATKWAKDNDLADRVHFGKLDVHVANAINETLFETLREFPELRKQLKFIGSTQSRNRRRLEVEVETVRRLAKGSLDEKTIRKAARRMLPRWARRVPPQHMAVSLSREPNVSGISINEKMGSNSTAWIKQLERLVAHNWINPAGSSLRSVVHHEVGHQLAYLVDIVSLRHEITDEVIRAVYNDERYDGVVSGLSEYGASDLHEFIAESWSEYKGTAEPRAIARAVGERIEQLIRERRERS